LKPVTVLFLVLAVFVVVFLTVWILGARRAIRRGSARIMPDAIQVLIGFVTNFFDTLGIGNFATTTSIFKLRKTVPDELMPGTLNVGHTLPVVAEALIYVSIIEVDALTLILLIGASAAGAWLGAPIVARWPRRAIQIGLGSVLIVAAALMLMSQLQLLPLGGTALALGSTGLVIGFVGSFWLGALMTLGLGFYAPCMIMISMLGMDPKAAFPIMMGACAFLMPVAGIQFVRRERYSLRPALGLTLGGIPGVLLAAFIVKSLPLGAVRWLVVCVVIYASTAMLHSAFRERKQHAAVGN
jgi:uncharacterized membrane protein YfcA